MRRLFFMLVILFLFYLGIQFAFYWFSGGQDNVYEITDEGATFEVSEKSNFNLALNSYDYDVTIDDTTFSFKIFKNYNKASKVLEKIEYYTEEDTNFKCILPIFKDDEIFLDMMCYDGESYNYYFNIKGKNENLDKFVSSIEEYDINQFVDDASKQIIEELNVLPENLVEHHYISFNNYRGVYIVSDSFNSRVYNISLFNKDVYKQELGQFVDRYYVIPDYSKEHEFNEIEVVDLVSLDTKTIGSDHMISFDSYIQGVVDNKVYLYDKDNAVQYEIDPSKETIVRLSSNEIKYYDGQWKTMTQAEANDEKKFITDKVDYVDEQYVRIDKSHDDFGYYYLYKKNGNKYDVYRMSTQDNKGLIYIFTTSSLNYIRYVEDYVYYIDGNQVKVYNDKFGVRRLIEYNELNFNKDFNFNVFATQW